MGKNKKIDFLRQVDESLINDKKLRKELDKLDDNENLSGEFVDSDVVEIPKNQKRPSSFNTVFENQDFQKESNINDYFEDEDEDDIEDDDNDENEEYADEESYDDEDLEEPEEVENINRNNSKNRISSSSVEERLFGAKTNNDQSDKKDNSFYNNKTFNEPQSFDKDNSKNTEVNREKKVRKPSVFNDFNSFSDENEKPPKNIKNDYNDFDDDEEDDDDEREEISSKDNFTNKEEAEEEDYSFEEKETSGINPNIEALFDKKRVIQEESSPSNKKRIPEELSFNDTPDEKIKSFSDSLRKDRKSAWDRLKQEAEENLNINISLKNSKKAEEESEDTIEKNVLDDSTKAYINFKKPYQSKIDTNNIHYSLIGFFDKLKFLGFNKEEAVTILSNFDINTINKIASLVSFLDIRPSILKSIKAYKALLFDLQSLNELPNSSLSLFFKNKNVLLNGVSLNKLTSLIKLSTINCGLLESRFFDKINLNSLTDYILKTKKQYSFRGYTVNGLKVCGLAISLQRLGKPVRGQGLVLNVYCKLGTTVLEDDTLYLFLARDTDNNNYVLIMK